MFVKNGYMRTKENSFIGCCLKFESLEILVSVGEEGGSTIKYHKISVYSEF